MKLLTIIWQRLVDKTGQTCDRCGTTYEEIQKALKLLQEALSPLAIEVTLSKEKLTKQHFSMIHLNLIGFGLVADL